jgi:hypothetical protein
MFVLNVRRKLILHLIRFWLQTGIRWYSNQNVLTRSANKAELGPYFSREFADVSRVAAAEDLHQPVRTVSLREHSSKLDKSGRCIGISRGRYPVTELIRQLLVAPGFVTDQAGSATWKTANLSISVARQRLTSMIGTLDVGTNSVRETFSVEDHSRFPFFNHRFLVADGPGQYSVPRDWFNPQVND